MQIGNRERNKCVGGKGGTPGTAEKAQEPKEGRGSTEGASVADFVVLFVVFLSFSLSL
jgi:hypothetical protein